jgi:ADP-ribosyl-[dinitrogen reductase] hydrolase
VNLGEDTDTIAAIAGGVAGIYYGFDKIPVDWVNTIIKASEINRVCDLLSAAF